MLRNIVIGVVALIAIIAVVGFFLPSTVTADRSVVIEAPPGKVFTVANSMRAFSRWSPWTNRDPDIKFSFEGPDSGVGQKMTWSSKHRDVGAGSMQITETVRDEKVVYGIKFDGTGNAKSSLTLAPQGTGTKVTWSFAYDVGANPLNRYVGIFMPSMIQNEYAKGLANLKAYVEAIPNVDFSNLAVTRVSVPPQTLIMVSTTTDNKPEPMAMALANSYLVLTQTLAGTGLSQAGDPISSAKGLKDSKVTIQAALPVKPVPAGTKLPNGVTTGQTDDGEALRVVHRGSYATLGTTYVKLLSYALTNGWKARGSSWNEYVTEPAKANGAELETNVYLPVE